LITRNDLPRIDTTALSKRKNQRHGSVFEKYIEHGGTIETRPDCIGVRTAQRREHQLRGVDDEIHVAVDLGRADSGPDPDLAAVGALSPRIRCANEEIAMLGWALTFLLVAIIAAIFGFGVIVTTAAGIAQILFVIFIVLFLASLIYHPVSGRRPPPLP
jgi:uncharacterized membrane protein YtjA (UPF0391 family)